MRVSTLYPVSPSVAVGAFQVTLRTVRSAFPQFPIKRPGASTPATGAVGSEADSEGVAEADSVGAADSVAVGAGVGAAASSLLFPFESTRAARRTIPITTSTTTRLEVPCFGFDEGFDDAGATERLGVGAVVTLTRSREPDTGTGGTTNRDVVELLRAVDFFTARFAVFFAVDFFAVFFAALFLATDFFTARFAVFLGAAFFAALFFLTATFTP